MEGKRQRGLSRKSKYFIQIIDLKKDDLFKKEKCKEQNKTKKNQVRVYKNELIHKNATN